VRNLLFSLPLLIAITSTSIAAAPPPIPESSATEFGYASPDAALAALREKPGVTIREENDWYVVNDPEGNAIWSITTPRNPVHPAGVKREFVQRDGGIHLVMSVKCGSTKEKCDELVRQFQELNADLERTIREKHK
jgi:hypothetical protein